jgi:FtsH-binding integral membrane protein
MNRFSYEGGSRAGLFSDVLSRVFAWMSLGLALTAGVSYFVFKNAAWQMALFSNPLIFYGLLIAQLVAVIVLSVGIERMSFSTAFLIFVLYSILNGLTLSSVFLLYTMGSIVSTFIVTAGMFGGMALYGYYTEADLSEYGTYFRMALFGLILALIINMFMKSTMFDLLISIFGVVLFAGLTAFDVQRIRQISFYLLDRGEVADKVALIGALQLYLDFINMFLYLLRLMGQKRDSE